MNSVMILATTVIRGQMALTCLKDLGSLNVINGAVSSGFFVAILPAAVGFYLLDLGSTAYHGCKWAYQRDRKTGRPTPLGQTDWQAGSRQIDRH